VTAIITKYHGPGNVRGSRISATASMGQKVTISYDHSLDAEQNHDAAAIALCRKMGWTEHNLIRGRIKTGYAYVFDVPAKRVEVTQ
jgi:hypothetical protein